MEVQEKNIKKRFYNSIKLGTGEAHIILKENPDINFSNIIIKGAINNYAYDAQSEGSRARYIFELIKISKEKDKIISKLFNILIEFKRDDWGLYQLSDLMTYLYKDGYLDALKYLNIRYDKNKLKEYDFCCSEQIIEIGGIKGILKIAEYIGEILYNNKDEYEDSWKVDEFQKKNKKINVYDVLKEQGQNNKYIKAYYDAVIKNKFNSFRRVKKTQNTYELITERIKNEKFFFISKERANELSNEEVEKLANDLLKSKTNKQKEKYLVFFTARKFPFDYSFIFELVKNRKRVNRLVELAIEALGYFKSSELREFGVSKLKVTNKPYVYLPLLINNYQQGDDDLLIEIINKSNNYDYIHSLIGGIIDIYKANKTLECKNPLMKMYNKMNCGLHRIDIIEILIENNVLDDKIYKEMKYDSDDEIRKMYRLIKKTVGNTSYNQ